MSDDDMRASAHEENMLAALERRSAELRQQHAAEAPPKADPNPTSWIGDVAPDLIARFRAEETAAIVHAAECTARPCERCARYLCTGCKVPVDGASMCRACSSAETSAWALKPTIMSIPPRFTWAIDTTVAMLMTRVKAPQPWVERGLNSPSSKNLLFTGRTGAGKTSLAVAMLLAWVRAHPSKRRGALFVEASWLARARARHKLGQGEAELVDQCIKAPLLLLDDLGQEREDRDGCITDVVYGRSAADLPTWVTCGLASGDLTAFAELLGRRYDGGFVRRILETGTHVELGGR